MNTPDILEKAKQLVRESGLTYKQIGLRMSYPEESARQSVSQFLNSTNPSIEMLKRFAEAMEIEPKELL